MVYAEVPRLASLAITPIDVSAPQPPYAQVIARLEQGIALGELLPGQLLPSERHLSAAFHVSRQTLRRALDELIRVGRLARQPGVGTFVADDRLRLNESLSFSERMQRAGRTPSSRIVFLGIVPAIPHVNTRLRLKVNEDLVCIQRVRLADGQPIMLQSSYLQASRFRGLLADGFPSPSLYRSLRDRFGVQIHTLQETVRACLMPEDVAALLECSPGAAGMTRDFLAFDLRGEPVEYCDAYVRGDLVTYEFTIRLGSEAGVGMLVGTPSGTPTRGRRLDADGGQEVR